MISELSQTELQSLILSVGTHRGRRHLSPMEVAALLRQAVESGASRQALSHALRISEIQISRFIKLFNLDPQVRDLADWGAGSATTISFSSLLEIARLDPSQQIEVARSALAHRLTKAECRQISQIAQRSGRHITDCIADVVERRPRVQAQFVLIGSIQQTELQMHLEIKPQDVRDCLLKSILTKLGQPLQDTRFRLGSRTFTILASQDISSLLGTAPDKIEAFVNQQLNHLVQIE